MPINSILIEGNEQVHLIPRDPYPLRGGPDDGEVVPPSDQRGIVVVHEYAIAQAAHEPGGGQPRLVYAVTGNSADENREVFHQILHIYNTL